MIRHPASPPRYPVLYEAATIATVATVAAAAVSAAGAISNANATSSAANYNAEIARNNALAAQQQAQQNALIQQRQSQQRIGAATAAYGASGITADGSPLDVLSSSASNAELDRQTILYKGRLQSLGYQDETSLDVARSATAQQQGLFGAASAVIGGATNYARLTAGAGSAGSSVNLSGSGVKSSNAFGPGSY